MIYFYVGLGFAMMTTIVSIFEISTTINKNKYTIRVIKNEADKTILQKQNDKKFLQMLDDLKGINIGSGQLICQNLKNGFDDELDPNYAILSNYSILNLYNSGIPSYTSHSKLKDGCDLVNDYHRVIIVPNQKENNAYNLYSCIINVDPKCPFELVE